MSSYILEWMSAAGHSALSPWRWASATHPKNRAHRTIEPFTPKKAKHFVNDVSVVLKGRFVTLFVVLVCRRLM